MRMKTRPSTTPSPQMANLGLNYHPFRHIHSFRSFCIASPPSSLKNLAAGIFGDSVIFHVCPAEKKKGLSGIYMPKRPLSGSPHVGCTIHSLPHDDLEFVCVIYHAPFLKKSKEPRTGGIKLCCLSGKDQSISAYPPRGRLVDPVIGESTTDSNLRQWPSLFASEARPMLSLSKTIMSTGSRKNEMPVGYLTPLSVGIFLTKN